MSRWCMGKAEIKYKVPNLNFWKKRSDSGLFDQKKDIFKKKKEL